MALNLGRHQLRVVSYNILSTSLCSASHFLHSDPKVLKNKKRWESVRTTLEAETAKHTVICLQEVSLSWTAKCHEFFTKRGYHIVTCNYGKPFNGFMGVAVAFPLEKYELLDCQISCVADSKSGGYGARERYQRPNWITQIWNTIKKQFLPAPEKDEDAEAWNLSRQRHNQMVMLKLKSKDEEESVEFCIGTYHMPCAFWAPKIMTIHTALAAKEIINFSQNLPFVFGGDFNFAPQSAPYRLLTTGQLEENDPTYPAPCFEGDSWKPELPVGMKSAYQVVNKEEPGFTNYAFVRGNTEPFIDTLDYLFYHEGGLANGTRYEMDAVTADPLPDKEQTTALYKSFPCDTQPSDHIAIGADFTINAMKK